MVECLRSIRFAIKLIAEMQGLLDKIKANAAARLPIPPGRQPGQELARYKAFLKVETHRLKLLHRSGASGLEVCRARSAILDLLIQYLWEAAVANLSQQAQKEFGQQLINNTREVIGQPPVYKDGEL